MSLKDWKIQWEELLIEGLNRHGIKHEKTSFKITPDLKKGRDFDWENTLISGQIVNIIYPSRRGGKLQIQAKNENSLPINVGTIEFYNQEVNYKIGIVCQLVDKDLRYANGDKRSCLEFDQPILLIDTELIPEDILNSDTFRLKHTGKKIGNKSGCFSFAAIILLFISLIIFLLP